MEENIEQNKSKSHKEFEELLNEDLSHRRFKENEIATGIIEEIGKKFVFIDLGLKSSGAVPIEEFYPMLETFLLLTPCHPFFGF